MEIKWKTLNFKGISESVKERFGKKISRLTRYYDKIIMATVFLKMDNVHQKENKIVELVLLVPGENLIAKTEDQSFENALDRIIKALKKQIERRKHKEKKDFR